MQSRFLDHLNPEQQKAVLHDSGPLLILAGAGSGKTTVLVSRTGRLIDLKKAKPSEICVLTFTNKAATELKNRVAEKLGSASKGLCAGTFHSFGLQVLKAHHKEAKLPKSFGITDSGDAQGIVKELLKEFKWADKSDFDSGKLLSVMADWRSRGITQDEKDDGNPYSVAAEWLLPKYIKKNHLLGVVDFDDLLLKPLELLQKFPEIQKKYRKQFHYVMVDEFQDTNKAQMALVMALLGDHKNLAVVGDDDQSIYGWRGACIENILHFPKNFEKCEVIRLERNYRSTPSILALANEIISKNEKRHSKILRPDPTADHGDLPELFVYENENEEVEKVATEIEALNKEGVSYKDFAILFRSNGQGALFEAELKQRAIPHRIAAGTGFFERKEIKDVLAYLRCAVNPNEVAFRRVINTPPRGIGEATIEAVAHFATENQITFLEAAKRWKDVGLSETIGLSLETLFVFWQTLTDELLARARNPSAGKCLSEKFEEIGYKAHVQKLCKDPSHAQLKWNLLGIFGNVLDKFFDKGGATLQTLREFIDAMQLHDDGEEDQKDKNAVQLLTLHACKGLEFPYVFLVGLEEDLLPHKSLGLDTAEERRLFYVGVTRAMKKLFMSRSRQRKRFGKLINTQASRFLIELSQKLFKEYELGWRPVSEGERKSMLSDLFKKIDTMKSPISS